MALKIFFTADVHLGMKFAGYPPHIQSVLTGANSREAVAYSYSEI